MCRSTTDSTRGRETIRFGIYNIHNVRNGGLDLALRGMSQANMYLGIFKETKLMDSVYTRGSALYSVVATDAPIRHCGGLQYFTVRHRMMRWRKSISLGPTLLASI